MKQVISILFISFSLLTFYSCDSSTKDSKDNKETNTKDTTPEAASQDQTNQSAPIHGIDISQFQGDEIDFLDKQKDNLSFVFCKATEGITYTDPEFHNNWKMIPQKGFIRGAYHFYRTADNPDDQAENFLNAIKDIKATDIPPVVDFEGGGIDKSQSIETIQTGLIQFLNKVEEQLNRKPMIYTDMPTGNKYLNDPRFAKYALWMALYVEGNAPTLPDAWKGQDWTFWQKASDYKIDGKKNDFDEFNGDLNKLVNFISSY